jgi:hypothetical protein
MQTFASKLKHYYNESTKLKQARYQSKFCLGCCCFGFKCFFVFPITTKAVYPPGLIYTAQAQQKFIIYTSSTINILITYGSKANNLTVISLLK